MSSDLNTQRPLSPHLSIYKPIPTMVMSILHRMTAASLYFGTLLFVWWLFAAATNAAYFEWVNNFFGSLVGRFILFCYTWALMFHLLGGIRHLVWDTGRLFEKSTTTKLAWLTLAGSIILTILIWVAGYSVR